MLLFIRWPSQFPTLFLGICCSCLFLSGMANPPATQTALSVPEELTPFTDWVGGWRGVAQPVRGSNRGAWSIKGDWLWDFSKGNQAQLLYTAEDGRQMAGIRIVAQAETSTAQEQDQSTAKPAVYDVVITNQTGVESKLVGKWEEDKFIAGTAEGVIPAFQLSIRPLHDVRLLILLEQKTRDDGPLQRIVEFGLTRSGVKLATRDSSGPECVVTGGEGTIAVTHLGKTYYVCCTGCKQAFDRDPEGILKAYFAKKQSE